VLNLNTEKDKNRLVNEHINDCTIELLLLLLLLKRMIASCLMTLTTDKLNVTTAGRAPIKRRP